MQLLLDLVDFENISTYIIFLIAGIVKGTLGVGLPTTAVSLLVLFFEPSYALALMPIPKLVTNFQQFYRSKNRTYIIKNYYPFALISALSVLITTYFISNSSYIDLRLIIGVAILFFCFTQVFHIKIKINADNDMFYQMFFGLIGGVIGGLTTLWSPTMMVYLLSKNLKKDEFVAISGFLLSIVSIPLIIGFYFNGFY